MTKILKNRYVLTAAALLLLVVFISGGMMSIGGEGGDASYTPPPSFTMTFTLADGQAVSVGGQAVASNQTRRMDYTAPDRWTETVTTSPDIVTSWGTFNAAGSYISVNGTTVTEYNAVTGLTSTYTQEHSGIRVPGAYMIPIDIESAEDSSHGIVANGAASTTARVCFNGACQDNHTGRSYTIDGETWVYADDARGIPLKIGDDFQAIEVTVNSAKQTIP